MSKCASRSAPKDRPPFSRPASSGRWVLRQRGEVPCELGDARDRLPHLPSPETGMWVQELKFYSSTDNSIEYM